MLLQRDFRSYKDLPHPMLGTLGNGLDCGEDEANVHIWNLGPQVDEIMLYRFFAPFGAVNSARVIRDQEGSSRCFGFVRFAFMHDAMKVCAEHTGRVDGGLNGYNLEGRKLHVTLQRDHAPYKTKKKGGADKYGPGGGKSLREGEAHDMHDAAAGLGGGIGGGISPARDAMSDPLTAFASQGMYH